MTNKKLDKNILEIAKKLNENGGRLYLVGGAIRDELLNIPTNDFDFCVTGVSFVKFQKLFPESKNTGKDFPVFLLDSHEFALARTERKVAAGYKGFEITSNENISIEDDLKRRDITINAIAKDVLTGKIIDPFNGINDLKSKVIKHVSKAFY